MLPTKTSALVWQIKTTNMIKLFGIFCLATSLVAHSIGIHDYSVPLIEGGNQPLSVYQGKRLLVITLPIEQAPAADSLLYSLDTLAAAHQLTHKVIAVPSFEDGFSPVQKQALTEWYRSKLGNYITITDGLYTRKSSGSQQHGLFQWLTHVTHNEIFDVEVGGVGHQFYVMPDGKLYGVLQAQFSVGSRTANKVLTAVQQPE